MTEPQSVGVVGDQRANPTGNPPGLVAEISTTTTSAASMELRWSHHLLGQPAGSPGLHRPPEIAGTGRQPMGGRRPEAAQGGCEVWSEAARPEEQDPLARRLGAAHELLPAKSAGFPALAAGLKGRWSTPDGAPVETPGEVAS